MEGLFEDIGFANVGVTDASGAEAEVERNWGRVQLLGSYTFTSTRNGDGGAPLSNSPRHLAVGRFHDAVAASSRDARHGVGLRELAPDDHGRRDLRLRTGQSDAYLR